MRLARFSDGGPARIGKVVGEHVIDLSGVGEVGGSMRHLIENLHQLRGAIDEVEGPLIPLADIRLEAPINDPQKFLAIGMNYREHMKEAEAAGVPIPTSQLWFNKQVSCITGPYNGIELPRISDKLDYECELGVVIGKRCRHVEAADARSVIAGYLICNDVSVRDWQMKSPTFTLGKSFDTHGPIGPWIVTDDEIADPMALEMRLTVNGDERQRTSTSDMVYGIYEQIAYLSSVMTLEPGDILATGTPSGVGGPKGLFLKTDDVVRIEIEGLGAIENRVIPEP